jgi:hypothetical protein
VSALKLQYARKDLNFSFIYEITIDIWCVTNKTGFYDLGQGHCGGSKFVDFDVYIHISRDGLVCSETNMHEKILFFYFTNEIIINV